MTQRAHVPVEQISDLLAGLLPAAEAMDVNAHLASCGECAQVRAALLAVTAWLEDEAAEPVEMPADVVTSLEAGLASALAERGAQVRRLDDVRQTRARRPLTWLTGAAAAVAVVAVGVAGVKALPDGGSSDSAANGAPTAGDSLGQGPLAESPQKQPGKESNYSAAATAPSVGPRELSSAAQSFVARPQAAVKPAAVGCAQPLTTGLSTAIRYQGRLVVLSLDMATKTVTLYDCASATHALLVRGY